MPALVIIVMSVAEDALRLSTSPFGLEMHRVAQVPYTGSQGENGDDTIKFLFSIRQGLKDPKKRV